MTVAYLGHDSLDFRRRPVLAGSTFEQLATSRNSPGSNRVHLDRFDLRPSDDSCDPASGRQRRIPEPTPDADRLYRFPHVMHAQQLRALLDRLEGEGERSAEALAGRRFVGERTDGTLATGAQHDRAAETVKQGEAVHQLEIMLDVLAEAEARIDDDPLARDAG